MTDPFLTYELLTPETADPVVIRITGQKARGFPDFRASCGVRVCSENFPAYYHHKTGNHGLYLWGQHEYKCSKEIPIPLSDWPAVKQAIRELNEAKFIESFNYRPGASANYKEKDMKHEKDEYEFPIDEWDWTVCAGDGSHLVLTRKKPKVCVEWRRAPSMFKNGSAYNGDDYGPYHIVQFRVTGHSWHIDCDLPGACLDADCEQSRFVTWRDSKNNPRIDIGLDARSNWSAPVLLPESVYNRLDEITKALEDRANGGKG